MTFRDHHAVHLDVARCVATLEMRGCPVPEDFLDSRGDAVPVVRSECPLVAMAVKQDRSVAHQLGHGLGARHT